MCVMLYVNVCVLSEVRNVQSHTCSMSHGRTMAYPMTLQTSYCSSAQSGREGKVKSH